MENELMALGNKIRKTRENQGLSIRDLADMADINKSQVVRIESGESDPHYTTLLKLARALGANIGELMEIKEDTDETT